MAMNRIQGASAGVNNMIKDTNTGMIVLVLLLVAIFFLGGYLLQHVRKRKEREAKQQKLKQQSEARMQKYRRNGDV